MNIKPTCTMRSASEAFRPHCHQLKTVQETKAHRSYIACRLSAMIAKAVHTRRQFRRHQLDVGQTE